MKNEQIKQIALSLVNAQDEDEVTRIISSNSILSNPKNWRAYGAANNNMGTATGQSPEAVSSFVEKVVNSIDAIMIKKCIDFGESPKSERSPHSMEDALKRYFNLDEEEYARSSDKAKRGLAEDIQIIADGKRQAPNLSIYDNGEGQEPQNFPNTFLSVGKQNKDSILFVQGKYNMGGMAVLPFSGTKWYQLIISRRNTKDSSNLKYGFTLVRLNTRENEPRAKNSIVDYCVDADGKIFEFESSPLDLGLYSRQFSGGTFIKLFEYNLPRPSHIQIDFWRELNRYLYKSALPVLLSEKRFGGKTDTKLMHGNRMRILLDERQSVEKSVPMTITSNGIKYPVETYVFDQRIRPAEFIGDTPVVFTMNGQVQNTLPKSFITSKAKKAYLSGSLLVSVDCTNMPRVVQERVFHSSRAFFRDVPEYRDLVDSLANELKNNDMLRKLDDARQREKVYQNPKDEEFLKKIMSKLVKNDSEIEKLLGLQGIIKGSQKTKRAKDTPKSGDSFVGKRFPSYFRFKHLAAGDTKMLPQNGECKMEIETDAEDELLIRPQDKGELKIKVQVPGNGGGGDGPTPEPNEDEVLDVNVIGPSEGQIVLHIKPNRMISVGEIIRLDARLSSPSGEFELFANIKIDNPNTQKQKEEKQTKQTYSMPKSIPVFEKGAGTEETKVNTWSDFGWDADDICKVQESSSDGNQLIDAVYINIDAKELHNYIKHQKISGKNIERVRRTYQTSVYLLSLVAYRHFKHIFEKNESNNWSGALDPSETVALLMKSLSKILLHITTNEALMKELEEVDV